MKKRVWMMIMLTMYSISLTLLYHAMRGVLSLGGMVASGGPYEIAHPAPGWIWIAPLSIFFLISSMLAGLFLTASPSKEIDLMRFSWPALFLALGWNFLDFGFGVSHKHGLVWSWLICAFFFLLMGLLPLYFLIRHQILKHGERKAAADTSLWLPAFLLQIILATLSVYGGTLLFNMLTE